MEEKYMIYDILTNFQTEITDYTNAIIQSEDLLLRQSLQNIRNEQESFRYDLFKLANSKGYYSPETKVKPETIAKLKNKLINSSKERNI
jgi:spore coat protein CotF